jgi:hypothetical protein
MRRGAAASPRAEGARPPLNVPAVTWIDPVTAGCFCDARKARKTSRAGYRNKVNL